MITNHLYIYKHVQNDMDIYLSKEKNHAFKTDVFVKLFKQDETKDKKNLKMEFNIEEK